jgi:Arc/MetJ-type ribon-helix-helix transcriptional regulator
MTSKQRLSASIDSTLIAAAEAAVRRGDAASVSAWVNAALHRQAAHDQRLAALDEFLAAFEHEHGEITELDMADATKRTRANAVVVRSPPRTVAVRPAKARRRSA